MNQALLATFGVLSAVINIAGLFPYIRDIFQHKTKPERATWWVWSALNLVVFAAQLAAGATWSLFLTGGIIISVAIIAVLSIKDGYGSFHRRDYIALGAAAVGVLLLIFLKNPFWSILLITAVDATGFWLTIDKTWEAPHTETLVAWVMAVIAAACGVLAVGEWNTAKLLYPVYVLLGNSLLVSVIVLRRRVVKQDAVH